MSNIWYGNIMNRLAERGKSAIPEVGMGATECCWSDRHAYEIIEVKDERHCKARQLRAKVVKGSVYDGSAEYEYEHDFGAHVVNLFRKKNGRWVEKIGRSEGCNGWAIGYAQEYYDPSF